MAVITQAPGPRRGPALLPIGLLALALFAAGGCQRALFPPDVPRTQFEQYDRVHHRYALPQEFDVFGNAKPALRARLSKKQ
jgi:hypothetical protein